MKIYLESSVLTDWWFLRTVQIGSRKTVKAGAQASYTFVKNVLYGRYPNADFSTSVWSLIESMQNYLRSRAMFNMMLENLSLRYYETVKYDRQFQISKKAFREAKEELLKPIVRAERLNRLRVLPLSFDFHETFQYQWLGFDAYDSLHLVFAINQEKADCFVTRDKDFLDQRKLLAGMIGVSHPSEILTKLDSKRYSMQEGQ